MIKPTSGQIKVKLLLKYIKLIQDFPKQKNNLAKMIKRKNYRLTMPTYLSKYELFFYN